MNAYYVYCNIRIYVPQPFTTCVYTRRNTVNYLELYSTALLPLDSRLALLPTLAKQQDAAVCVYLHMCTYLQLGIIDIKVVELHYDS